MGKKILDFNWKVKNYFIVVEKWRTLSKKVQKEGSIITLNEKEML